MQCIVDSAELCYKFYLELGTWDPDGAVPISNAVFGNTFVKLSTYYITNILCKFSYCFYVNSIHN